MSQKQEDPHDWSKAAKRAFEQRDEAKKKLREAEQEASVMANKLFLLKRETLESLRSSYDRGLVVDLCIPKNGEFVYELTKAYEGAHTLDKFVARIEAPASIISKFMQLPRHLFDVGTWKDKARGLMGYYEGAEVFLNNHIEALSPPSEKKEDYCFILVRFFLKEVCQVFATDWMETPREPSPDKEYQKDDPPTVIDLDKFFEETTSFSFAKDSNGATSLPFFDRIKEAVRTMLKQTPKMASAYMDAAMPADRCSVVNGLPYKWVDVSIRKAFSMAEMGDKVIHEAVTDVAVNLANRISAYNPFSVSEMYVMSSHCISAREVGYIIGYHVLAHGAMPEVMVEPSIPPPVAEGFMPSWALKAEEDGWLMILDQNGKWKDHFIRGIDADKWTELVSQIIMSRILATEKYARNLPWDDANMIPGKAVDDAQEFFVNISYTRDPASTHRLIDRLCFLIGQFIKVRQGTLYMSEFKYDNGLKVRVCKKDMSEYKKEGTPS